MKYSKFLHKMAIFFLCLSLSACEKPIDKEARYLKKGNAFFEQGDFTKARLEYKNAAQVMPTDAEPRYKLGLVDEAEGDIKSAYGNFMTAEQQDAHYRPALLKLAQYYLAAENYDESQKRISKVLADAPDDADARAIHAALLFQLKNFEETEKEASFALKIDHGNIIATSVLTGLYSSQNDQEKAARVLDEGIKLNPESLDLLSLKVKLYQKASNLDKVVEAFLSMLKLKPQDDSIRMDLARVYLDASKPDLAETVLRDGISLAPNNMRLRKNLVAFLDKNHGIESAEHEIQTYIKEYPHSEEYLFWLAELYISHDLSSKAVSLLEQIVSKQDFDQSSLNASTYLARIHFLSGNQHLAEQLVAKVLKKNPENTGALVIRAKLLLNEGQYQQAVADLRNAIRIAPKTKEAFQILAEILLLQGHLDLAIDTLSQFTDIDSTNSVSNVRLAQMYSLNGNTKKAYEILDYVKAIDPNYPVVWETIARIAISNQDWPKATTAIDILDKLQGHHLTSIFLRGQVLANNGKHEEALSLYKQVITSNPSSALAEHALTELFNSYRKLNQLTNVIDLINSLKIQTPYAFTILGQCFVVLGNEKEGLEAFDKAIANNGSSQDPYIEKAQLLFKNNQSSEAISLLRRAKEIFPTDIRAPIIEASYHVKLKNSQLGIDIYKQVIDENPDMDPVANNLAQAIADYQFENHESLDKARQVSERFAGSKNVAYLDTLGWVYIRQNNLSQAQIIYDRIVSLNAPLPPEIHYHYAYLLNKVGKKAEAEQELKLATVPGSDYVGINDAKELLQNLAR